MTNMPIDRQLIPVRPASRRAAFPRVLPLAVSLIAGFLCAVSAAESGLAAVSSESADAGPQDGRYRLQYSDVIELTFPLSPEFNKTVTVQPDGYIETIAGKDVHALGMTLPELEEAVKQSYSMTLHNPIVSAILTDYQHPSFTVTGQVGHPGRFDLRARIRVSEAVAMAGGLTLQAKWNVFLVRPLSTGVAEVHRIELGDAEAGEHLENDLYLKPGDLIYVPETWITKFRKYIPYYLGANLASVF